MTNNASRSAQDGYAMAALLVGLAVMGIMLSMAMPVWRTMVQREKEEELVFRGQQYARAIGLYQRKYANAFPPNLDILIEQRFLRKKYADPMAKGETGGEGDFQLLYQGDVRQRPVQATGGRPGATGTTQTGLAGAVSGSGPGSGPGSGMSGGRPQSGQSGLSSRSGQSGLSGQSGQSGLSGLSGLSGQAAGPRGGVVGVTSKSKAKSIRIYNGRSVYNEWQFVWTAESNGPGAGRPGQGNQPGQGQGRPGGGPAAGRGSAFDPRK